MVSAHLDKLLRREYKKRSLVVRKDDEVKILRGGFAGRSGKVTRVDLKKLKVYVDSAKVKKVSGQEVEVAIDPSNVVITKLNLDDKKRKKFIIRKQPAAKPLEKKDNKTKLVQQKKMEAAKA